RDSSHTGQPARAARGSATTGAPENSCANCRRAALAEVQPPDLVVDLMSGHERHQLALVAPLVVVEDLAHEGRGRAAAAQTHNVAGQVPLDRSAEGVFEVVP